MGTRYNQLGIEERCEIARLHAQGQTIRKIAASLDRAASTVARELKRNGSRSQGYQPRYANQQSRASRWTGSKLERDSQLRELVLSGLGQGWSPEQVAGRLARESGRRVISHESIYRFIYGQMARKKDYLWRHYLPRGKSKRGWRGRKGGSPASFIHLRRPLAERPREAVDRREPGQWEADLMAFGNRGRSLLALQERHSRLLLAVPQGGKESGLTAERMKGLLSGFPAQWRRTVTFDNETEFAQHYRLHELGMETFFCDTYSPWQKNGVENGIGGLRRCLPRKMRWEELSRQRVARVVRVYNNTPRKCLGYQTPVEPFMEKVLHLKCESTFPLSRG